MNFETLSFEKQDAVGVLKINRPKALNALNGQVITELGQFFDEFPAGVRCLVISGEGEKAFVAGADIKEMQDFGESEALKMAERGQSTFDKIQNFPVPVVAAVNGFALGGGFELALSCDFIVASSNAKLGLPEVSLGLIPGYGGTQRLTRVAGKNVARMMTLTGDMYSAEQGKDWGIVAEVTEPGEALVVAVKFAKTIAKRSPTALALAKKSINEGADVDLERGLQIEASYFATTFTTKDKVEGVSAFIEKRKPEFLGE